MGKYMRKCRGDEVAAMEVTQAVGVRTRSRAAAVAKRTRRPLPPSPLRAASAAASAASPGGGQSTGSCYLKLRSRMLFMAPPPPSTPAPAHDAEAGHVAPLPAGLSRCSSTASSVDASSSAPQDRSMPCRSDAAEAGSDNVRQGSASGNNSESGRDDHRDRRETTPSSRQLAGESSDLESDLVGPSGSRSLPSAQVQAATRARMPEAAEIEEFFAAAEEAQAKRFASKYNFDVARGVPLSAGRFEWTPAVSS